MTDPKKPHTYKQPDALGPKNCEVCGRGPSAPIHRVPINPHEGASPGAMTMTDPKKPHAFRGKDHPYRGDCECGLPLHDPSDIHNNMGYDTNAWGEQPINPHEGATQAVDASGVDLMRDDIHESRMDAYQFGTVGPQPNARHELSGSLRKNADAFRATGKHAFAAKLHCVANALDAQAAEIAELREALEAIAAGRTKAGVAHLYELAKKWNCLPRGYAIPGYGELVTQIARAALAPFLKGDSDED